jgi:magnesium chelatase family protein
MNSDPREIRSPDIAAMNPCPCSYAQSRIKPCTCASGAVIKYQKHISSPVLDRIDIHIEVPEVDYEKLSGDRLGETSTSIRKRVQATRDIQNQRFKDSAGQIICNADMRVAEIREFCKLDDAGQSLMRAAMSQLQLSARAYTLAPAQKVQMQPRVESLAHLCGFGRE